METDGTIAVRPYPKLRWHLCGDDQYWSVCGRWVSTLSSVYAQLVDVPEGESVCKICVAKK